MAAAQMERRKIKVVLRDQAWPMESCGQPNMNATRQQTSKAKAGRGSKRAGPVILPPPFFEGIPDEYIA